MSLFQSILTNAGLSSINLQWDVQTLRVLMSLAIDCYIAGTLEGTSQLCRLAWVRVWHHNFIRGYGGLAIVCSPSLTCERVPSLNFWLSFPHRVKVYLNKVCAISLLNQASKILMLNLWDIVANSLSLMWHYNYDRDICNQLKPLY